MIIEDIVRIECECDIPTGTNEAVHARPGDALVKTGGQWYYVRQLTGMRDRIFNPQRELPALGDIRFDWEQWPV